MDLANDFKQVAIGTTAGAFAILSTASGTRVPVLAGLYVGSTAKTSLRIKSATTGGSTFDLIGTTGGTKGWPLTASELSLKIPFDPRVKGSLRGLVGGNLQIGSTTLEVRGVAIVGWTTQPAT